MAGKYAALTARANKLIARKGSVDVVWIKAPVELDDADNPTPEFPATASIPLEFIVNMAFYPVDKLNLNTMVQDRNLAVVNATWVGVLAGDQEFKPAIGDVLRFPDNSKHSVLFFNETAPDTVAVVYEVYMT